MRVFIITTGDKTVDGHDFTADDVARSVLSQRLFADVAVRASWQAMGTEDGMLYDAARPNVRVYQDHEGYKWLDLEGDGKLVCIDRGVARRIRHKYPVITRDAAEHEFGPLTELSQSRAHANRESGGPE